jgi:hypothetical protein
MQNKQCPSERKGNCQDFQFKKYHDDKRVQKVSRDPPNGPSEHDSTRFYTTILFQAQFEQRHQRHMYVCGPKSG